MWTPAPAAQTPVIVGPTPTLPCRMLWPTPVAPKSGWPKGYTTRTKAAGRQTTTAPAPSNSKTVWPFMAASMARKPPAASATRRPTSPSSAAILTKTTPIPTVITSPRPRQTFKAITPTTWSLAAARTTPPCWTVSPSPPGRPTGKTRIATAVGECTTTAAALR